LLHTILLGEVSDAAYYEPLSSRTHVEHLFGRDEMPLAGYIRKLFIVLIHLPGIEDEFIFFPENIGFTFREEIVIRFANE
jgi:hypothetical protein